MILTPKPLKLFRKGQEFADIYGYWILDEGQNSKVYQFSQAKRLEDSHQLFKMWCSHKPITDEIGSDYQIRDDDTVLSINVEKVNSLEFETENEIETIFEVYFT